MSVENLNSIIDLKVDVHRKNSSESIEFMFYAPSMMSGSSQQDQQSIVGSTSATKSLKSNNNSIGVAAATNETSTKYLTVPEHVTDLPKPNSSSSNSGTASNCAAVVAATISSISPTVTAAITTRSSHLLRKSSEVFKRHHQRRRLERQSSLDAAAESGILAKLMRNQSDTIATAAGDNSNNNAARNETFLHSHTQAVQHQRSASFGKAMSTKINVTSIAELATTTTISLSTSSHNASTANAATIVAAENAARQRLNNTTTTTTTNTLASNYLATNSTSTTSAVLPTTRNSRLQRHRSSETHDERIKHQNRSLFLPIHHEPYQSPLNRRHNRVASTGTSSSGALAAIGGGNLTTDEMELELGGSASGVAGHADHVRALQSWILGSSSDVYIEDDSLTKSDFGIEKIDAIPTSLARRAAFLLQQQQHFNSHYQHQQQYRSQLQQQQQQHHQRHHSGANIRKGSNSTMSALQLPSLTESTKNSDGNSNGVVCGGLKRRRHSLYKSGTTSSTKAASITAAELAATQQPTVRRIKSTALEKSCQHPSVSNLTPHPNSVEAINGQQQIKNNASALLPPPSKCLVRNPHLNLCPKFGSSFGGSFGGSTTSGGSLNFDASASNSTTALIDLVYAIAEQVDERASLGMDSDMADDRNNSNIDLEIAELDVNVSDAIDNVVHSDNDNDDEDDNDDMDNRSIRRRRKALSLQAALSVELDVGEILAAHDDDDDDEFKDFDDNLEHILNDLQQTHNQLDDLKASYAAATTSQEHQLIQNQQLDQVRLQQFHQQQVLNIYADRASTSQVLRQRLHSTDDSETDNNGSRSPLLSGRHWEVSSASMQAAETALRNDIATVQRQQQPPQHQHHAIVSIIPQHLYEARASIKHVKGEGDSGCPSSDCEQVSASSKDMLLAGLDDHCCNKKAIIKDVEVGTESNDTPKTETATTSVASSGVGKSLGAIPKVVKYREIDEMRCIGGGGSQQLHKRRHNNNNYNNNSNKSERNSIVALSNNASLTSATTSTSKNNAASSRTSSSTSSRSISADSFSADIHKMLWLMHGGPVDERGRPIAGIGADGAPITASSSVVPPNMSTAHFQFYQDAIQALNTTYPTHSSDGLSLSERIYYREKIRRSSKQISGDPSSCSFGDCAHVHDFHTTAAATTSALSTSKNFVRLPEMGIVSSTGSGSGTGGGGGTISSLNTRNLSNAATLSIQGLINVMNDERNPAAAVAAAALQARAGGSLASNTLTTTTTAAANAAAILNVDGHHIENQLYNCDYWRPACFLGTKKPVAPKTFYKYHFKFCGYEREFKIVMDRLELLALFDRDLHWLHILLSVVLCALVAYLGATILQYGYYKDLFAFLFCAIIASAQYSLVKSVQPDAASPIHGFNKIVAYSRAIYFSLCGGFLLILEQIKRDYALKPPTANLVFFGVQYSPVDLTGVLLHMFYIGLLCFPLVFSLGLLPQINTFLMYFLEQFDMHVFGGNAAGSLLGSFICVLRSILGVMFLYGPLYAALHERRGTQYIVFSIFCAMLIPLGYHLSRSGSDFSHIWVLIKNCIVSTYRDDDDDDDVDDEDELSATSASSVGSRKLTTSTSRRHHGSSSSAKAHKRRATTNDGICNENIEMTSMDKMTATTIEREDEHLNLERKSNKLKASSLGSSSQTIGKTLSSSKNAITTSNSYASVGLAAPIGSVVSGIDDAVVGTTEVEGNNTAEPQQSLATCLKSVDHLNDEENIASDGGTLAAKTLRVHNAVETKKAEIKEIFANEATEEEIEIQSSNNNNKDIDDTSTTNPGDMSTLTAGVNERTANVTNENSVPDTPDPLPKKLRSTVNTRLKNDLVVTTLLAIIVFGLHCSTVFTVLQPDLNIVLYAFTGALGLLLHYIIPQMRKHMPWLCFSRPILRQKEFGRYEVSCAPKVMWFEKVYIYLCIVERNVLFPLLALSALTADTEAVAAKFGIAWGTLIVAVCALKFIRNAYSDPTNQYLIVMFTVLILRIDFAVASETFLIDYFFVALAYRKCCDFLLKLQFIVTYIAPWQITWGSAFHAFAQPFSVPHSAMLFSQAAVSALFSTPLNPFLGSAIFLTSYVRPIKFWERDYNTRRIDHSNTRLSSQLERDLGADDNNLNSIFYEHLTRSLQHSLCGDLIMGRWGNVNQGDCFVLASDYLNCLVHIIELGNGLCTFQMRGLEFRGTYCQQREVEAITEDVEDNIGCCCCDPGHLPRMLSANAMFSTRWLAWQVVAAQYVLEGYSISDNLASATLQVFEYRKVLITYYLKSIVYYVIKNPKLEQWLASEPIQEALQHTLSRQFVDLDPIFNYNLDEDFDFRAMGITRASFCYVYLAWINYCCDKRKEMQNGTVTTGNAATTANATNNAVNAANNSTTATDTAAAQMPAVCNDSKSTPNLSTPTTTQIKSQSQQQLRTRPQKSATMSGSGTVNTTNHHSTEHMVLSQSFANISRQTSESAPGLTGATINLVNAASVLNAPPIDNTSLNDSTITMGSNTTAGGTTHLSNAQERLRNIAALRLRNKKSSAGEAANSDGNKEKKPQSKVNAPAIARDSPIVSLCLALGLLARRSLATASHSSLTGVEYFLHGLHALFKGDFRITSPRDEWVFADMELLHSVVAPAVKMALKLQQDHISNPDEFLDPNALYEAIDTCSKDLVISHEADPVWRSAVLRGAPNLLALRHVMEDGSDEYRIIRLTKRFLTFRVIKLNRECVRGLWSGQQQELIYLRNANAERGSIQNAKQALRNIINSSCDQPIGYPIYVSPLTTSYADTNDQLREVIGGAITLESIKSTVLDWWQRIREHCRQGCSSGSMETSHLGIVGVAPGCNAGMGESGEIAPVYISAPLYNTLTVSNFFGLPSTGNVPSSIGGSLNTQYGSDGLAAIRTGLSVVPVKPTSSAILAALLNREREEEREREAMRGLRKSTQSASSRCERERRATLPIACSSAVGAVGNMSKDGTSTDTALTLDIDASIGGCSDNYSNDLQLECASRYTYSGRNIGSIITTPGDYPRKYKGPMCLTAANTTVSDVATTNCERDVALSPRKPRIDLFKKVIIVDDVEIYDCLNLRRRTGVIWPNEEMRDNGGRLAWKDWVPRAGMVGYVVHYWIPNHADQRFRSHVNRILYLVAIGEFYVPVSEYGLKEYNQIVASNEELTTLSMNSRRSSMQCDLDDLRQQQRHQRECERERDGLTPILGSSLESPTSHLASGISGSSGVSVAVATGSFTGFSDKRRAIAAMSGSGISGKTNMKAVSSSSSEDEIEEVEAGLENFELQRRKLLFNVWKFMADKKKENVEHCPEFDNFYYDQEAEEDHQRRLGRTEENVEEQQTEISKNLECAKSVDEMKTTTDGEMREPLREQDEPILNVKESENSVKSSQIANDIVEDLLMICTAQTQELIANETAEETTEKTTTEEVNTIEATMIASPVESNVATHLVLATNNTAGNNERTAAIGVVDSVIKNIVETAVTTSYHDDDSEDTRDDDDNDDGSQA